MNLRALSFVLLALTCLCAEAEVDLAKARQHWAYRQPQRAAIPAVQKSEWPLNDIDRFILATLERRKLSPGPDASKEVLIRRLYFDLIGLPPTPDEIDAFLASTGPRATEQLVDKLLASPHFGERWGRHWLDVARYAESVTLRGLVFSEAWRYRDYVIDSFNRDLPFNQFIKEQIAGDLLDRTTLEEKHRARIATTFLVLGNFNYEEQDKEQLRMDIVDEQLDTIGKAFLAQTLGCARCHDHKFDPIPARDYYAMAGILRNTKSTEHANVSTWLNIPLPVAPEEEEKIKAHELKLAELQRQVRKRTEHLAQLTGNGSKNLAGIVIDDAEAKLVGFWKKSRFNKPYLREGYIHDDNTEKGAKTATFHPELKTSGKYEVRLAYTSGDNRASNVPVTILHSAGESTVRVNQKLPPPVGGHFVSLGQFDFERGNQGYVLVATTGTDGHVIADAVQFLPLDEVQAAPAASVSAEVDALKAELNELRLELKRATESGPKRPMAMSVREEEKVSDCQIHLRGSVHRLGETVPRGFLSVADYLPPAKFNETESGRRQLAEWIASPANPLTARVIVNRAWHWLLGSGIVRSTDNFGTTGNTPSHPELLDYLATRFVENGWSMKQLVREIVLSRTYQLASEPYALALEADPENHLFARANRKRLAPELMRDTILAVAGKLDPSIGGPTVKNGTSADYGYLDTGTRRGIYVPAFRNALPQIFELFDFADTSVVTGQRNASVVAPQALFFLNHPFIHEHARFTAERLLQSSASTRFIHASRAILGRPPTPPEQELARQHLAAASSNGITDLDAWTEVCQALFASPEFRFVN